MDGYTSNEVFTVEDDVDPLSGTAVKVVIDSLGTLRGRYTVDEFNTQFTKIEQ